MKRKNRIRGMIVCLVILLVSFPFLMFKSPPASMLVGLAAGWALRESLQPKETEEIRPEPKSLTDVDK